MYDIKKNSIIYKIYNKIRKSKKNIIICLSLGVDSNMTKFLIKRIIKKNKILKIFVNHKINTVEKKIKYLKKNFFLTKIKNKKLKNIEKFLKKKRFKKIKNICNKKKSNVWIAQNQDEILENFIIQLLVKKEITSKIKEREKKNVFKKIKILEKNKKKFIKNKMIKNKIKWFEDKDNIKYKNIRNKIRINLLSHIKINLKDFKKTVIKTLKRDMAEGFKAFPC